MEELGEFDLVESKVSDVDNLYMDLDILDNDMAKTSRPSSTASFASWTFSPIQEDDSGLQDPQIHSSTNEDLLSSAPQFYILSNQPNSNQALAQKTVNLTQHHVQNNNNSSSEYHFPKNVTYHHSVNIHNYLGNYCVPTPLLKDACMWEGMGQPVFPAVSSSCHHDQNPAPLLKAHEHPDPIASLTAPGVEFTRCSTPEYMMALNSLHQLDSPPRPNHSAALDFSCSASFEDSTNQDQGNGIKQQDSGYNSDLNVSPVIQFQGNPAILEDKQKIQTSTPNPYQQYMKVPPMQLMNKENINHHHPIHVPHRYTVPGFQPQILCPSRQPNLLSPSIFPANVNTLEKMRSQFIYNKTDAANNGSNLQFKSVADQHTAKKKNSQVKQKVKSEIKVSNETSDSFVNGTRRRHNEPLNNHALDVMNGWYQTHRENPYPTKLEKEQLAKVGGITLAQVKSWFANKRNRNNNTRPKKQKIEMEERLLELCHQLARDARRPTKDNAYYIQKLSSIIDTTKVNPGS